jgi:aminoglycoside phosphotransferase (APT) family kinase protein
MSAHDVRPVIDTGLVRRLIAAQFPQWTDLPVRPVEPGGNDNRTFHLGDRRTVRLPSAPGYAPQVAKEQRWLPVLARHLPLPVPTLLGKGVPGEGFSFDWSIYQWIDGETASVDRIDDLTGFASALADFLTALRRIDATSGPAYGLHSAYRGGPLETYDAETRRAIEVLGDRIPRDLALAVWETALNRPWRGEPVWFHGDVASGNLLLRNGKLAAVIDFGCAGVGDPACDLAIAWTLLSGESRRVFRSEVDVDAATWARGRAWTLWKALITLPERGGLNSNQAREARRVLDQVLTEFRESP